jgi:hypothetical protein
MLRRAIKEFLSQNLILGTKSDFPRLLSVIFLCFSIALVSTRKLMNHAGCLLRFARYHAFVQIIFQVLSAAPSSRLVNTLRKLPSKTALQCMQQILLFLFPGGFKISMRLSCATGLPSKHVGAQCSCRGEGLSISSKTSTYEGEKTTPVSTDQDRRRG